MPPDRLKILVGAANFSRRTGMPRYIATLCREFIALGHQPYVVAPEVGLVPPSELAQITFADFPAFAKDFTPDVLLLNEPQSVLLCDRYPDTPAYNIVHSARPEDEPIMRRQVRRYICPKKIDADYCRAKGIPEKKILELPIPVDLVKFDKKTAPLKWDIIAPCTFDQLRKPMLADLINKAIMGKRVLLIGDDHGALADLPSNVTTLTVLPTAVDNIVDYIAQAKMVASLFEGTVAIEGWAMGKPCLIYDINGKYEVVPPPKDITKHHAPKVARSFVRLFKELWADIIIPHHNRADLLAGCLESLPKLNYNIIVAKYGGTFAENNNQGARHAKTKKLFFVNDDTISNPYSLWEMLDSDAEVVGCPQVDKDGKPYCVGIGLRVVPDRKRVEYFMTNSRGDALYPSGGFFKINADLFWELGGFPECYRNGGEDQDIFLQAYELGATFDRCMTPITHFVSQSDGRFTYVEENERLLRERWLDQVGRLQQLFNIKGLE